MVLLVASSSVALGERFERAVAYAIAARRDRRRPASEVPYVAHLFGVCAIVLEHGGSESEAISALLSGTIDDEHGPEHLKVIRNGFGDDVAAIVDGCTGVSAARAGEGPPLAFYDRTQVAIERLRRHAGGDEPACAANGVFLVSAANALYAARATSDDLLRGLDVFAQLPGKKFGTLWAYRALADAYREELVGAADGRRRSFGDALAGVVDAMAGKPVTAAELLAAFSIDDSVDAAEKGSLFAGGVAR